MSIDFPIGFVMSVRAMGMTPSSVMPFYRLFMIGDEALNIELQM